MQTRNSFSEWTKLDLAVAVGLDHVDEASDCQGNHKADHANEDVESDCHEL